MEISVGNRHFHAAYRRAVRQVGGIDAHISVLVDYKSVLTAHPVDNVGRHQFSSACARHVWIAHDAVLRIRSAETSGDEKVAVHTRKIAFALHRVTPSHRSHRFGVKAGVVANLHLELHIVCLAEHCFYHKRLNARVSCGRAVFKRGACHTRTAFVMTQRVDGKRLALQVDSGWG